VPGGIEVHAFSLMTTHFLLLVRSPEGELSESMRRIPVRHTRGSFYSGFVGGDGPLIRAPILFQTKSTADLYLLARRDPLHR
jgi:hypothetical protein